MPWLCQCLPCCKKNKSQDKDKDMLLKEPTGKQRKKNRTQQIDSSPLLPERQGKPSATNSNNRRPDNSPCTGDSTSTSDYPIKDKTSDPTPSKTRDSNANQAKSKSTSTDQRQDNNNHHTSSKNRDTTSNQEDPKSASNDQIQENSGDHILSANSGRNAEQAASKSELNRQRKVIDNNQTPSTCNRRNTNHKDPECTSNGQIIEINSDQTSSTTTHSTANHEDPAYTANGQRQEIHRDKTLPTTEPRNPNNKDTEPTLNCHRKGSQRVQTSSITNNRNANPADSLSVNKQRKANQVDPESTSNNQSGENNCSQNSIENGNKKENREDKTSTANTKTITGNPKCINDKQGDNNLGSGNDLIIAFDIGSKMSGFAYACGTSEDPTINKQWPTQFQTTTEKTLTIIMREDKNDTCHFGNDAYTYYIKSLTPLQHALFNKFQWKLIKDDSGKTQLVSFGNDYGFNVMDIKDFITKFIVKLYKIAKEQIPRKRLLKTRFIFTHPYNLGKMEIDVLRQCILATVIKKEFPKDVRVELVSEDIAAALWCEQTKVNSNKSSRQVSKMIPGTNYCIVDCGGRTITLTTHESQKSKEDSHNKNVFSAVFDLDEKFQDLLITEFKPFNMEDYLTKFPTDWLQMLNAMKLYSFCFKNQGSTDCVVQFPSSFVKYVKPKKMHKIEKYIKKSPHLSCNNYSCFIKSSYFHGIFNEVADQLYQQARDLPEKKKYEYLFVIGGSSLFLFDPIWNSLKKLSNFNECCVIQSSNPMTCVLKGAVIHGQNISSQPD